MPQNSDELAARVGPPVTAVPVEDARCGSKELRSGGIERDGFEVSWRVLVLAEQLPHCGSRRNGEWVRPLVLHDTQRLAVVVPERVLADVPVVASGEPRHPKAVDQVPSFEFAKGDGKIVGAHHVGVEVGPDLVGALRGVAGEV
ncbi:hypothetical protein ACFPRL_04965 [Pseudoclavibacter helvolus]